MYWTGLKSQNCWREGWKGYEVVKRKFLQTLFRQILATWVTSSNTASDLHSKSKMLLHRARRKAGQDCIFSVLDFGIQCHYGKSIKSPGGKGNSSERLSCLCDKHGAGRILSVWAAIPTYSNKLLDFVGWSPHRMTFSEVLDVNVAFPVVPLASDLRMRHQRMPSSCLYLLCQRTEVKMSTQTVIVYVRLCKQHGHPIAFVASDFDEWLNFM